MGSFTPAGGAPGQGNSGLTDQSPRLLKSTVAPENLAPPKSTVLPENLARLKPTSPRENLANLKPTSPPENLARSKLTKLPEKVAKLKPTLPSENLARSKPTKPPENMARPKRTCPPENLAELLHGAAELVLEKRSAEGLLDSPLAGAKELLLGGVVWARVVLGDKIPPLHS